MISGINQGLPQKINGSFQGKDILTIEQFAREDLEELFAVARNLRQRIQSDDRGVVEIANRKVLALLFFEPSTRTDLSFQAAMARLGGKVISASNGIKFSSLYKGEDLADTMRTVGCYADVIVLRHPEKGTAALAASQLDILTDKIGRRPTVINAGDGIGEHPTQALLDLFTILQAKESLQGLHIVMAGDLLHGRTVHSLSKALAIYASKGCKLTFVAPPSLKMPANIVNALSDKLQITETDSLQGVLQETDVLYWTRVQEERFKTPAEYDRIKNDYIFTAEMMAQMPKDAILLHPLPRKHEMGGTEQHKVLDQDPRAFYFQQAENGMLLRMALLAKILSNVHI